MRFPWSQHKDVLACAGEARRVRTPRPAHRGGHPCSRLWAMKRRIPRLGPSDMGLSKPIKPQQTGKPRNSRHRARGGKGRLLGNGAVVELASQCRRDITTIFQPASLTPHSHRRPPFFSTLLQNCPFSLFPSWVFYRIWSSFSPVACGNPTTSISLRPLTASPQHTASDQLWTPRSLSRSVDTQPYRPTTAGLTRSLEVNLCEP